MKTDHRTTGPQDYGLRTTDYGPRVTCHASRVTVRAFTLIEMLAVIAIISILAAMIFPITKAVNRNKAFSLAKTELANVESAIENYRSKHGSYPPDNPAHPYVPPYINQLYYELIGTTNNGLSYKTLDGSAFKAASAVQTTFTAVSGFVNCSKGADSDSGPVAVNFLKPGLKPSQVGKLPDNSDDLQKTRLLVCSVPWPAKDTLNYTPTGILLPDPAANLNPFRYVSTNPTNNPKTFDLWVDIVVAGVTSRICNWSQQPIKVSTP